MASLSYTDDPILDERFKNARKGKPGFKPKADVGAALKFGLNSVGQDIRDAGTGVVETAKGKGRTVKKAVNAAGQKVGEVGQLLGDIGTAGNKRITAEGLGDTTRMLVEAGKKDIDRVVEAPGAVLRPALAAAREFGSEFKKGYTSRDATLADAPAAVAAPTTKPVQDIASSATPGATDPVAQKQPGTLAAQNDVVSNPPTTGEIALQTVAQRRASPEYAAERAKVNSIRGTQQENVSTATGLGSVGGVGSAPDYVEFVGENTAEGRAKAEADAMRRNVFHRTYDSDAVRTARINAANDAADSYYKEKTGNQVDRERIAATKQVGLANVDARNFATASTAQTARQAGLHGTAPTAPDYDNLTKKQEYEDNQQYRAAKGAIAAKYVKYLEENGEYPEEFYAEIAQLDQLRGGI